jgi:hypothetical protein
LGISCATLRGSSPVSWGKVDNQKVKSSPEDLFKELLDCSHFGRSLQIMGESLFSSRKPIDITERLGSTSIGRIPSSLTSGLADSSPKIVRDRRAVNITIKKTYPVPAESESDSEICGNRTFPYPAFPAHYHDLAFDAPEVYYNFWFLGLFR